MSLHPDLAQMERTMAYPVVSFSWQDEENRHEWHKSVVLLLQALMRKERSGGQVLVMMGGGGSSSYGGDYGKYYRAARMALLYVMTTSSPCMGHILASRVTDVLEARLPGEDDFHANVMSVFHETAYETVKDTRDLSPADPMKWWKAATEGDPGLEER